MFRKFVVSQNGGVDAQKSLRKYFTEAEMSNLWGRLKRHINGANTSRQTKDEWSTICAKGQRSGKTELKNNALMMQLSFPRDWEDRWVHEVRKVSTSKAKGFDVKLYYKGELEQLHGVAEANKFIEKGKYEQVTDDQGDICYRKVQHFERESTSRDNVAEFKSSSKIEADDVDKVHGAINDWFESQSYSVNKAILDGKSVNKKPAMAILDKKRGIEEVAGEDDKDETQTKTISPEDVAKQKARKMCTTLSSASIKLLNAVNTTKKGDLSQALRDSLKTKRNDLEKTRSKLMSTCTVSKPDVNKIKKDLVSAAGEMSSAIELLRMAKAIK